jgi:hypothetical protein
MADDRGGGDGNAVFIAVCFVLNFAAGGSSDSLSDESGNADFLAVCLGRGAFADDTKEYPCELEE